MRSIMSQLGRRSGPHVGPTDIMTSPGSAAWRRWIPKALAVAQAVVVLLMVKQWANVTTYRLYLDRRSIPEHSAATQHFDIEGDRVVPRVVTRGPDRLVFKTVVRQDSTIHVGLRPIGPTTFAIEWRDGSTHRVLAHGAVHAATSIVCRVPTGNGVIELVSDNAIAWVDPRVVHNLQIGWHAIALAMLIMSFVASTRWRGLPGASEPGAAMRMLWFKISTVAASATIAVLGSEIVLRAIGDAAPNGFLRQRHDLGDVTRDPRWEDSPRYGRRLRRNADTLNEWRDGDIVRMGYIPPAVSEGILHQFRVQTDAEGFRNPLTRGRFDIAALGDSFTDATTMAVDASWPMQLEHRLGVAVQNYGTAGFGPQQELLVLQEFVAAHRPRVVVLAFFAGNDIFDAEAFDKFERAGVAASPVAPGWRINEIVRRADTWYVVSAWRAGIVGLGDHVNKEASAAEVASASMSQAAGSAPASFDRGMFTVPVGGRVLRWAFLPPYLNTLNLSEDELAALRGWTLTRNAIGDMQKVSRSFGAEFIVMFIPFKSQVYFPLLERAFSHDELRSAFQFYLGGGRRPVDLDAMRRNRLAQNDLMRRLCGEAGIPFLDTTTSLETHAAAGENVYFPDDSHLNERGQAVLADALSVFLRARQIPLHGETSKRIPSPASLR
jgi:lysophospholipase L1-like esterase